MSDKMNPREATAMTPVAIHPVTVDRKEIVNLPMTEEFVAIRIKSTMMRAAARAFNTASQISALIG
jgi:hypothetical protein